MTYPSYPPAYLEPYSNDPYYIPGWTAQNEKLQTDNPVDPGQPLPLPADIPLVVVTGSYVPINSGMYGNNYSTIDGTTYGGGSVLFQMLDAAVDSQSDTVLSPGTIRGWILNGKLSGDMNTQTDLKIPAGFTYLVREITAGGRRFTVTIPANQVSPTSINALAAMAST
jgi:hypothetical protein